MILLYSLFVIAYNLYITSYNDCFVIAYESDLTTTLLSYNQDGRIDYGEFVAMMTKGNMGVGRRTMRNSLNISMRDAPAAL